jgi:hypothetical protein
MILKYLREQGIFGWNYKYLILHPWKIFTESYYRTKWFLQRGWRGYSDRDNWSIDSFLNNILPEMLRNLKNGHGYPVDMLSLEYQLMSVDIPEEICEIAHKRWQDTLENMARGFEAAKMLVDLDYDWRDKNEEARLRELSELGFYLFKKHYNSLWD